jgi:HSP20 family protein
MFWSDSVFNNTLRELEGMRQALRRLDMSSSVEFPATNVWASDDNAMVTTEIAGVNPDDIEITTVKDTLTLRGIRKTENHGGEETHHRRERWTGQFSKTLQLPFTVEANKVEARFVKGVLYIKLPRAEADKPKKISIKSE